MPLVMQAKLLRVLEEGQVERVGGDRAIPVDVRVIVATHRNLDELVRRAHSARICIIASTFTRLLPPLRERTEDIQPLAEHFARQVAESTAGNRSR
jgi:two-component system, NtrC family, nitrogen regulation response regulator NtrX